MIYESTVDNLITLMRVVGCLKKDQILAFFSDCTDANNVDYYIKQLIQHRILDYDEKKDLVSYHLAPKIKDAEMLKRIQAFWVVVSFRSNNVRELALMPYPTQFILVTDDNEVYDLTVCMARTDAQLAARVRKAGEIAGVPDEVNHVAITNTVADGEELAKYGFDSFCVINANKVPEYHTW